MKATAIKDVTSQDLDSLLECSRPRRTPSLLAPMFLAGIIAAAMLSVPGNSVWVQPVVPLVFAAVLFMAMRQASRLAQRQREDAELLRMADEGLRLARWDQVNAAISKLLSRPANRPHVRFQGLIYLGGLLNRVGRYHDVIRLYDDLQAEAVFPPPIATSLRCMKAYAMLRDDRLSDAYEAVAELRRESSGGSGMVSVLELYRLVKTGHHEDALALFEEKRAQITEQMAHRSADAWALAAVAALSLSRSEQAAQYARNAALLADSGEIVRRFPECERAMSMAGGEAVRP